MSKGKVKWFDPKKGYGFIEWENGQDVFVHYTEIKTRSAFKKVEKDDIVEFDLIQGAKGLQAKKVTLVK